MSDLGSTVGYDRGLTCHTRIAGLEITRQIWIARSAIQVTELTFDAGVANLQVGLQIWVARFHFVQFRVRNADVTFGFSRTLPIQQRQYVLGTAEEFGIVSHGREQIWINVETSSGLHSSPAR